MHRRLHFYHQVSLYAVVAFAFIAAAAGDMLSPVTVVLFTGAAAGTWFVDESSWLRSWSQRWWNALLLAFLAGTVVYVVATGKSYLLGGIRFVLALIVVRLIDRGSVRNELQLYALSFLLLAAGTTVNEDVTFGIAFGAYVLAGTLSLALFHLRREIETSDTGGLTWRSPFDRGYVAVLAALSVGIFVSSLAIFFGFPRIGLGYFAQDSREGTPVSGFSNSVELGSHGTIRDNNEVAMRVEFPDGRPASPSRFHWRTVSFDHYDGTSWSQTIDDDDPLPQDDATFDLGRLYPSTWPRGEPEDIPRKLEIYVEPIGRNALPTLWPARRIRFNPADSPMPANPRSGRVYVADPYGDLYHTIASDLGVPYTLELGRRPEPDTLRAVEAPYPESGDEYEDFEPFLQLPGEMDRIEDLARRVAGDAETPYAKAEAIEEHLRTNYAYTTDLPSGGSRRPVQHFLFERKRGHCEYYATAMALMLRTLDIPARVVNGFLGGTWNDVGGYLSVQQGDAHSWVEVYIPGYRWVPLDPTPAGEPPVDPGIVRWTRQSWDAVRMAWMQWVIEYDLSSQIDIVRDALKVLRPEGLMPETPGSESEESESGSDWPLRPWIVWGGLLLAALVAGFAGRRLTRRRRWFRLGVSTTFWTAGGALWLMTFYGFTTTWGSLGGIVPLAAACTGGVAALFGRRRARQPSTELFRRIEAAASDAGLGRGADEAPGAFLERLADEVPGVEQQLDQFRRRYLAARFGGRPLDDATYRQLREDVDEIVRALRSHSS